MGSAWCFLKWFARIQQESWSKLSHLHRLFYILQKRKLYANDRKWGIGVEFVDLLGCKVKKREYICSRGLSRQSWVSQNLKKIHDIQSFLGFCRPPQNFRQRNALTSAPGLAYLTRKSSSVRLLTHRNLLWAKPWSRMDSQSCIWPIDYPHRKPVGIQEAGSSSRLWLL